jgi:hypothetical protein
MEALAMSAQRNEFIFSVDTEEVTGTIAPPTPVIAAPRRRVTAPTIALRLPDLRVAAPEETPASRPLVQNFEMPVTRPQAEPLVAQFAPAVSLPILPRAESGDSLAALDDLARASVAQLVPTPAPAAPIVKAEASIEVAPAAGAEPDVYWKNPKFMLAGVAAAFLGMVSLMAMNHEEQPVADDAPKWTGPSVALPERASELESGDLLTPRVTRGGETSGGAWSQTTQPVAAEDAPVAHTAQLPPERTGQPAATTPVTDRPWIDPTTGRERIVFEEEISEDEGTARIVPPLPNLATPAAREANQAPVEPSGSYRY